MATENVNNSGVSLAADIADAASSSQNTGTEGKAEEAKPETAAATETAEEPKAETTGADHTETGNTEATAQATNPPSTTPSEETEASGDFNFGALLDNYERESAIQEGEIKRG